MNSSKTTSRAWSGADLLYRFLWLVHSESRVVALNLKRPEAKRVPTVGAGRVPSLGAFCETVIPDLPDEEGPPERLRYLGISV